LSENLKKKKNVKVVAAVGQVACLAYLATRLASCCVVSSTGGIVAGTVIVVAATGSIIAGVIYVSVSSGGCTGLACNQTDLRKLDTTTHSDHNMTTTADVNECLSQPCRNNGACQNNIDMYTCSCHPIYTGENCQNYSYLGSPVPGKILTIDNGHPQGSWKANDTCPAGSYAAGIDLKIENYLSGALDDDTAVNGIAIKCFSASSLTEVATKKSGTQMWGDWWGVKYCPNDYYIVDFQMKAENDQGIVGDDTGTNGLKVKCRGPGLYGTDYMEVLEDGLTFSNSYWGSWSGECEAGKAVCAIQTKIESNQGVRDDNALGDVKLYCCLH